MRSSGTTNRREVALSGLPSLDRHRCGLCGAGRDLRQSGDAYDHSNASRAPMCIFQYTLSGEGRFRDPSGRTWALPAGTGFLDVFPSETRYWLPPDGRWEFAYVLVDGDTAFHHCRRIVAERGRVLRAPRDGPLVGALLEIHEAAVQQRITDEFLAGAMVYRLLMELYRLPRAGAEEPPEPVARATAFIESNYGRPDLTIDDAAEASGYSRWHFSRLFRVHTGTSPYAYLLRTRMRKALELTRFTDMPIKRIARETGFRDCSHFCSVFKKFVGATPTETRRRRLDIDPTDIRPV